MAGQQINAYSTYNQYGRNQYNSAPFAYNQYAQNNPNMFAYSNLQMKDTVAFGNAEVPVAPAEAPEKKSNTKGLLIAGGVVLAAVGLIFHKKSGKALGLGKEVVKGGENAAEKLTKEGEKVEKNIADGVKVVDLKLQIKTKYIKERDDILRQHNLKYKKIHGANFHVEGTKDYALPSIQKMIEAEKIKQKEISNKVKSILSDLQSDKDWIDLRQLRKKLRLENLELSKQLGGKTKEQYMLNRNKLSLIDDVLAQKATGNTLRFNEMSGLDVADAIDLIKTNDKSLEEFVTKQSSLTKYESNQHQIPHSLNIKDGLSLNNFFNEDIKSYEKSIWNIEYFDTCYNQNLLAATDLKSQLISLAEKTRKSNSFQALNGNKKS